MLYVHTYIYDTSAARRMRRSPARLTVFRQSGHVPEVLGGVMLQTETTHRAQNEWPHSVCVCTRPSASHSPIHMGHVASGSEETERTRCGMRFTRSSSDSLRSPFVGRIPSPCRRKSPRKVEYKPRLVFVPGSKGRSKDSMTPTRGRPFAPRSQSVDWFGQKTVKRRRTPPLSVYVRSTSLGATCAPFHEKRSLAMTRSSLPLYTVRTSYVPTSAFGIKESAKSSSRRPKPRKPSARISCG